MKNTVAVTAAAALFGALPLSAVEVDGVAAKVGSAVILKSDVIGEMRRTGSGADAFERVRNGMIERELVLRAAGAAKMQMQEWVVESRIREVIDRVFDGDRNKLLAVLAKDKVSYPEWRQRLRDDLIVGAMRWQVVDKNVTASPAAMRAEYESHPERYAADHRVTVSAILLGPDDVAKKAEIDEALKTEPFAELAKRYSADAHAKEGGQWKDVKPEDVFRPGICAEIAQMPKNTISRWIELDGWNFLLRKDDESGGTKQSFAEAYDKIAENVRRAESARRYTEWIERLKAQTYIKVY